MARINVVDHCPHCPDNANIKDCPHRVFGLLVYDDSGKMIFPQWFNPLFPGGIGTAWKDGVRNDWGSELADLCIGNDTDADLPRYLIVETEMDDELARFIVAKDPRSFIETLMR